jgi:hypothetical protein
MDINEQIDFFFKESIVEPIGDKFSTLYLLRRDIFTCLGFDPNNMNQISYRALWPGVMSILAGIDLLGKYLEGDDIDTSVSRRFKNYYKKYFDNGTDCEIIYQLRNSMLHSFGLYSFNYTTINKVKTKTQEYFFVLDRRNDDFIVTNLQIDRYAINIIALCNAFEKSIDRYLNDLKSNNTLKLNFEKMFPFYAGIYVR